MKKLPVVKIVLSVILGSLVAFMFFVWLQFFFQMGFPEDVFGFLFVDLVIFIMLTSLLVFCFLWNFHKSKFVYLLFFVPFISIAAFVLYEVINTNIYQRNIARAAQIKAEEARIAAEIEAEAAEMRPVQDAQWLFERHAYPRGYFAEVGLHGHILPHSALYILAIENSYPVIKRVDIFEGELIIISQEQFDLFRYDPRWGGSFAFYSSSEDYSLINIPSNRNYICSSINSLRLKYIRHHGLAFIEKVDGYIPAEFLWLTMDGQAPYTGNFVFDELQIIRQYNYEFSKEYFYREISVVFSEDGRLQGKNFPHVRRHESDRFRILPDRRSFAVVSNLMETFGFFSDWRFADINTIYHRYISYRVPSPPPIFVEDHPDFHSIEYVVRYVRR